MHLEISQFRGQFRDTTLQATKPHCFNFGTFAGRFTRTGTHPAGTGCRTRQRSICGSVRQLLTHTHKPNTRCSLLVLVWPPSCCQLPHSCVCHFGEALKVERGELWAACYQLPHSLVSHHFFSPAREIETACGNRLWWTQGLHLLNDLTTQQRD